MTIRKIALLLLLTACPALANTIIVTSLNASLGLQQSLYFNEDGVAAQAYWVGAINISVDGYSRETFCVDLFTNISFSSYSSAMSFPDTGNLRRVGWLMQNQYPITQIQGAAFQLAIWDIMHDNGDGFNAGRISKSTDVAHPTDAAVLAAAANYETVSVGQSSTYGIIYHNATFSGTPVQNLVGRNISDGGPSAVPEPADLILVGSGLALIVLGRRRSKTGGR
ncbi:MAG: PEP-CTERM sorting domain-containing protein [Candidatus Solibacter sp.]